MALMLAQFGGLGNTVMLLNDNCKECNAFRRIVRSGSTRTLSSAHSVVKNEGGSTEPTQQ